MGPPSAGAPPEPGPPLNPVDAALLGLALGASLAVPPGPMNAWIAAASVRSYRAGLATGFGAMTADALLGTVVYLVHGPMDLRAVREVVYALGAGVMAYFAVRLARRRADPSEEREFRSFSRALLLGLSNPFQVLWWLTAGIGFAFVGGAILLFGLFGAIVVWVTVFPLAVRGGARRWERFERAVALVSTGALAAFAVYFAVLAVTGAYGTG